MKDKSTLITVVLVIITVIIVIVSNLLANQEQKNEEKIFIVTNYSNFYTVNSCLYRFITYLSSNDLDNSLLILDDVYEKKNNITKENILEIFPKLEVDNTFVSKKMYYKEINKNITNYYVMGNIEKNNLIQNEYISKSESNEVYFIVSLDSYNKTFSVAPYDGKIFIEGVSYEG